jgi:hypothetical protein
MMYFVALKGDKPLTSPRGRKALRHFLNHGPKPLDAGHSLAVSDHLFYSAFWVTGKVQAIPSGPALGRAVLP